MTVEAVREIAIKVFNERESVTTSLMRLVPKLSTKEACMILECDRKWLYAHAIELGGRKKNKRGDYEFDTTKVVDFKLKNTL